MPPRNCAALVPLALLGAAGCLVYTDPVNQPPDLAPLSGPDRVRPFEMGVEFRTDSSDVDLTYRWALGLTCPADLAAAKTVTRGAEPSKVRTYPLPAMSGQGERCITVVAEDALGATAFRTRTFFFVDRRLSIEGPADVSRGETSPFMAKLVEDGRPVSAEAVEWGVASTCPTTKAGAKQAVAQRLGRGALFQLDAAKHDDLGCVVAVAGEDFATAPVTVGNRAPTLSVSFADHEPDVFMSASPTYARFAPIEAIVLASDPERDPVVLTAFLSAATPDGTRTPVEPCAGSTTSFCFAVPLAGTYDLEVGGKDADGAAATAVRRRFFVKDAAPCLARLHPATDAGGARIVRFDDAGPVRFVVDRVIDDADPFPVASAARPHQGAFFWHVRPQRDDAKWTYLDGERSNALEVDVRPFRGVDAFEVRVEYHDAIDLTSPVPLVEPSATAEGPGPRTPCAADAPLCGPPSCPSRFTWTVALK